MATKAELEARIEDLIKTNEGLGKSYEGLRKSYKRLETAYNERLQQLEEVIAERDKLAQTPDKLDKLRKDGLLIWEATTDDGTPVTCVGIDNDDVLLSVDLFRNEDGKFEGQAVFYDTDLLTVDGVIPTQFFMAEIEYARKHG